VNRPQLNKRTRMKMFFFFEGPNALAYSVPQTTAQKSFMRTVTRLQLGMVKTEETQQQQKSKTGFSACLLYRHSLFNSNLHLSNITAVSSLSLSSTVLFFNLAAALVVVDLCTHCPPPPSLFFRNVDPARSFHCLQILPSGFTL